MLKTISSIFQAIGEVVPDDAVSRGALAVSGAIFGLAGVLAGRLFRRSVSPAERVRVNVDAPEGQQIDLKIGPTQKRGGDAL